MDIYKKVGTTSATYDLIDFALKDIYNNDEDRFNSGNCNYVTP